MYKKLWYRILTTFFNEASLYQVLDSKCHGYKWPILTGYVSFHTELDNKASNLSALSQKYKKDARYLNLRATYAKIAFGAVIALVIFLYFWVL